MNLTHMKCVIEVAKAGSINKASEVLLMAPPNISRSIKELESDLGIELFYRTARGMSLTPEGEKFVGYAEKIIDQVDDIKNVFTRDKSKKLHFSVSVPRATYISEAFVDFSKCISGDSAEIFYHETNSSDTIRNILNADYKLGIVRYAEHHDKYFKTLFERKGLSSELIAEFNYKLVMSKESPLANKAEIHFEDLCSFIEIAHADQFVPSLPLVAARKEELPDSISKRIFVFERGSQFELLDRNPETFMWVSPLSYETLKRFNLVQAECGDNRTVYKDVLIYRENYRFTDLDKLFVDRVLKSKAECFGRCYHF